LWRQVKAQAKLWARRGGGKTTGKLSREVRGLPPGDALDGWIIWSAMMLNRPVGPMGQHERRKVAPADAALITGGDAR